MTAKTINDGVGAAKRSIVSSPLRPIGGRLQAQPRSVFDPGEGRGWKANTRQLHLPQCLGTAQRGGRAERHH